jgi:UDP-2-acetamido-3-amino-2,3-dideoxy-glucuronate N-acetyltransferase
MSTPVSETFIHPTSIVDPGAQIGEGTKIWHFCHISAGAVIGQGCILGQGCYVGPRVRIGNRVKIQNGVSIYEGVILEDEVFCGPHMIFTNVINPRAFIERKKEFRPTRVCRGATIGAGAVIVCGHTIGPYAMIGAGAVVTKDVPAFGLVYGNPARLHGWVDTTGTKLAFDAAGRAVGQDGTVYILQDGVVWREIPSAQAHPLEMVPGCRLSADRLPLSLTAQDQSLSRKEQAA